MGFPDRIQRTVALAHPPARVWAALTTAEGLAAWFGEEADIDLRPGGAARMRWASGYSVDMRVERVEEPAVFGFTWQIEELPEDDPRRTYVEFTLEPAGSSTRSTRMSSEYPLAHLIRAAPPGRRSMFASSPNQAARPSAVVSAAHTFPGG